MTEFIECDDDEGRDEAYFEEQENIARASRQRLLFHASSMPDIEKILDRCDTGFADFGGVFTVAHPARCYDGWYGNYVYEVRLSMDVDIASMDDIRRALRDDAPNAQAIEMIIAHAVGADIARESTDTMRCLKALITSDSADDMDADELFDRYHENFCADEDQAAWEIQALRARIAKIAGFAAIDEGDGILVFPGADIRLSRVQNPSAIEALNARNIQYRPYLPQSNAEAPSLARRTTPGMGM